MTDPSHERALRLRTALYVGRHDEVAALLAADPGLPQQDLGLAIALYDRAAVAAALAADPAAATEAVGLRTPILHLAFSRHIHATPEKRADMLAIAHLLAAAGADVNDAWTTGLASGFRLSALYGALGHADNMALAEWLLEHGASPDDGESLYHSTELGHHDGLKLLIRHGVRPEGTNALARMLDFDDIDGLRLLLDHGADPNERVPGHPSGEGLPSIPALHQAARRGRDGRFADLLLERGADPLARWEGHTPYALARIYGNASFAAALTAHGHATTLDPAEALLAGCADGTGPAGRRMADLDPGPEARRILTRVIASPDRLAQAKALVAAGVDPNQTDEMGLTPLHLALWEGLPEQAAWLLTLAPDLTHRNGYGGDAVGTLVHGAENCPHQGRDHLACLRLLRRARAPLDPQVVGTAADPAIAAYLREWSLEM